MNKDTYSVDDLADFIMKHGGLDTASKLLAVMKVCKNSTGEGTKENKILPRNLSVVVDKPESR